MFAGGGIGPFARRPFATAWCLQADEHGLAGCAPHIADHPVATLTLALALLSLPAVADTGMYGGEPPTDTGWYSGDPTTDATMDTGAPDDGTDPGSDLWSEYATCGDGSCDADDLTDCPEDCETTPTPTCGDSTCEADEDPWTCPEDCGPATFCGDATCDADEDADSCPEDCSISVLPNCGDGTCEGDEDPWTCPEDCDSSPMDEDTGAPPEDTGDCGDTGCWDTGAPVERPPNCGDDFCGVGEDTDNCPEDCDAVCGDGECDYLEESHTTCPEDCAAEDFERRGILPGPGAGITGARG